MPGGVGTLRRGSHPSPLGLAMSLDPIDSDEFVLVANDGAQAVLLRFDRWTPTCTCFLHINLRMRNLRELPVLVLY